MKVSYSEIKQARSGDSYITVYGRDGAYGEGEPIGELILYAGSRLWSASCDLQDCIGRISNGAIKDIKRIINRK